MKKLLLSTIIVICICACNNYVDIKSTTWTGINNDSNVSISFRDSTCEIYKSYKTGFVDTMSAIYKIKNDTISFTPLSENVTIGTSLIISGKELKHAETNTTVFKLKQ